MSSLLIQKLKDGLQEAVVFLRTLESVKMPGVFQRRRKELMGRLEALQDDSLSSRSDPPKFEESPDSDSKKEEESVISPASSMAGDEDTPRRTLPRMDSKVIGLKDRIKNYELIEAKKKDDEAALTLKRHANEKEKSPEPTPKEPSPIPEPAAAEEVEELELENSLKPESAGSTESMETVGKEAKSDKKKKKKGGLRGLFKKDKDTLKPSTSAARAESPAPSEEPDTEAAAPAGAESDFNITEGGEVSQTLERKIKQKLGRDKWVKQAVRLKEGQLCFGDKECGLAGCSVSSTDTGFELSTAEHKSHVFKVEGEDAKGKWVEALQTAITDGKCQEEPQATESPEGSKTELPSITVETPAEESTSTPVKKKRDSKAFAPSTLKAKSEKVLPEAGVELKSYVHRKKGLKGWEKTYAVLTYQALYFTTIEDNKEYTNILHLAADGTCSLSEKKGHDKHSQSLVIKAGKKSEQISVEAGSESARWKEALDRVIGTGDMVGELLSEDEEIPEDLYEELEVEDKPPAVPSSPRPAHVSRLPSVPDATDFQDMAGEDIYEDTDDFLPTIAAQQPPAAPSAAAPQLPTRNPPKKLDAAPAPTLPPRNSPGPSLPPRNANAETKKPAPLPVDDELYDDVVATTVEGDEAEEVYDDVIAPADADIEEMYDDVTPQPITEETYEDMTAGAGEEGPQEEYVIMEPGQEEGDELYVDVEEPPKHVPIKTLQSRLKGKAAGNGVAKLSQMFGGGGGGAQEEKAGSLKCKTPKKSVFTQFWCKIEKKELRFFRNSTDKLAVERLPLDECELSYASGGAALKLCKAEKVYHFTLKNTSECTKWVGWLRELVKRTTEEQHQEVYQATEDHIGGAGEITFKKGSFIRLVSKSSPQSWTGQLGNDAQVFEGKVGKFPASKVEQAEDMYI